MFHLVPASTSGLLRPSPGEIPAHQRHDVAHQRYMYSGDFLFIRFSRKLGIPQAVIQLSMQSRYFRANKSKLHAQIFRVLSLFVLHYLPCYISSHKVIETSLVLLPGLLWSIRPGDIDTAILNITRSAVLEIEKEEPAGWTTNGGLFIANNMVSDELS